MAVAHVPEAAAPRPLACRLLLIASLLCAPRLLNADEPAELPAKIAQLVAQLDAPSLAVRQNAEDSLVAIGKPALSALAEARRSENIEVRLRAGAIAAAINEQRIAEADVYAIGIYEAGSADDRVVVRIESAPRPVVLAVCAWETVHWDVRLGAGVELIKVIASGHHPQKVLGTDASVQLLSAAGDEPAEVRDKAFFAYMRPSVRYDEMCERIKELTGKELSSFQCRYDGGGKPFVIGAVNK
ncbi:MAG TPA: hypothetical protein VMP01_02075 [Pirellulaceae bacterium]|nr:hypothetical protein [Pirellulaceae bacterium]